MKKAHIGIFFALFLLVGGFQAFPVEANLFAPYEGSLQLDLRSVNQTLVLRQRLVLIRLDLLPQTPGGEITLNLFEDVVVRAVCDRVESSASGAFAWFGHVRYPAAGRVTLSVADQTLAGSVEISALTYSVRSFHDQVHVIREIRLPAPDAARASIMGPPSSPENEVAELVNVERAIQNLQPMAWNDMLGTAARGHSEDMALQNYFSHTSLDGRIFSQRITAAGYSYNACGENIAAGYSTPQAVMNGWMNSPGHRANILNPAFCDIGVGYAFRSGSTYGHYWTQDFGRRQGLSTCPPVVTEYTITATAGPHGTIAPSGSVKVLSGASQTFLITPAAGYGILEVKVDGVSVGATTAYTFDAVARNHSIEVSFAATARRSQFPSWLQYLLLGD